MLGKPDVAQCRFGKHHDELRQLAAPLSRYPPCLSTPNYRRAMSGSISKCPTRHSTRAGSPYPCLLLKRHNHPCSLARVHLSAGNSPFVLAEFSITVVIF